MMYALEGGGGSIQGDPYGDGKVLLTAMRRLHFSIRNFRSLYMMELWARFQQNLFHDHIGHPVVKCFLCVPCDTIQENERQCWVTKLLVDRQTPHSLHSGFPNLDTPSFTITHLFPKDQCTMIGGGWVESMRINQIHSDEKPYWGAWKSSSTETEHKKGLGGMLTLHRPIVPCLPRSCHT